MTGKPVNQSEKKTRRNRLNKEIYNIDTAASGSMQRVWSSSDLLVLIAKLSEGKAYSEDRTFKLKRLLLHS